MKTRLLWGLYLALAGLFLNEALSIGGLHSDPAKLHLAKTLATWIGLLINLGGISLGLRACRSALGPTAPYPYGAALKDGAWISLWAACFSVVATLIYFGLIDPNFRDVLVQGQINAMEAKGLDPSKAERMLRVIMSVPVMAIFAFFGTLIFDFIISLVVAIFLRREPPPVSFPA